MNADDDDHSDSTSAAPIEPGANGIVRQPSNASSASDASTVDLRQRVLQQHRLVARKYVGSELDRERRLTKLALTELVSVLLLLLLLLLLLFIVFIIPIHDFSMFVEF
jgi:hypothetical protein